MKSSLPHNLHLRLLLIVFCSFVFSLITTAIPAHAQSPLVVDFEFEPLFVDADVKPGDSTTRSVTVTNNTDETQQVYFTFSNTMNTGLADVMLLTVTDTDNTLISATSSFADQFSDGEILLGQIAPNSTVEYLFTASIPTSVGNDYQETSFGFDLIIGFQGGESVTDTPTGGGGGGGGGGLNTGSEFSLFNVDLTVLGDSMTMTWNTNRNASSHVACRLLDGRPFVFSAESPFGYDFVIPEIDSNTQTHSMTQTGLEPGDYECIPASRENVEEDGFTTGSAFTFEIEPPEGEVAGEDISSPQPLPQPISMPGTVLGAQTGKFGKDHTGGLTYEEWQEQLEREREEREQAERERDDETEESDQSEVSDSEESGQNGDSEGRSTTETTIMWLLILAGITTLGYVIYRKK